ncbi:SCP2 sterol-binding domain-containing protein [Alkalicoccus urumqiensis]|uniref:SCP2 domain-containing protein n=1 Tax=Alkalicoccus urumqiensis TaxID=1548213 RepID=A0A2P6MGK6_ALKUR|nr:SCP2 sterol-binding domain-containing protein [Alkalicoccus urumqiensis]PRO65425.1 hypothetical protein C6I21_09705 [Alkalicoccus urumqiensis]
MTIEETLRQFTMRMEADPEPIRTLQYTYEFIISDDPDGVYQLDINQGSATYYKERKKEPDLSLEMDQKHFEKLADGDLNAAMAYMTGKLKVHGEVRHALKFQELIKKYRSS